MSEPIASSSLTAEQVRRFSEAITLDFYANLGLLDPRDIQADMDGYQFFPYVVPPYYRQNQGKGEVLPVYVTEQQLRLLRDRSRKLCAENEFAICALENRRSFVVGKGFTYEARPRDGDCPPWLVKVVQKAVNAFVEANELNEIESETLLRCDRDGEAFLRFFPQRSGLMLVRFIEPEHISSPVGGYADGEAELSFGIETDPRDVEDVKGYHLIEDPANANYEHVFVPAGEVLHVKLNTDRTAKRGLPTFYPVEQNLRRAEDLLASMTSMAKTRAKLAMIRRVKGTTRDAATKFMNTLKDAAASDPRTNTQIDLERLRWGSILTASDNIDYEFPSADVQASDFVQVLQAELRAVASRLSMPEYMLTADASNANYSSTLVAESPAIRMFERLQHLFKRKFGELRYKSRESAVWKQLRHLIDRGILPREVLRCIDIQVEGPSLTVRNQQQEASVNALYLAKGIKSKETIRQEIGLDGKQEDANFKKDAAQNPPAPQPAAGTPPQPWPATESPPAREAVVREEKRTDKDGNTYCVDPGRGRVPCGSGDAKPGGGLASTDPQRAGHGKVIAKIRDWPADKGIDPSSAARAVRKLDPQAFTRPFDYAEAATAIVLGHRWRSQSGSPGYDTDSTLGRWLGDGDKTPLLVDVKTQKQGVGYVDKLPHRAAKMKEYRQARKDGKPALNAVVFWTDDGVFLHLGMDEKDQPGFSSGKGGRGVVGPDELAGKIDGSGGNLPAVRLSSTAKWQGGNSFTGLDQKTVAEIQDNFKKTMQSLKGAGMEKVQQHLDKMSEKVAKQVGENVADDDLAMKAALMKRGMSEQDADAWLGKFPAAGKSDTKAAA